jgi:hypothetical protein
MAFTTREVKPFTLTVTCHKWTLKLFQVEPAKGVRDGDNSICQTCDGSLRCTFRYSGGPS